MTHLLSFLAKPEQYLDPGSGSLIVQIVLAAVMGAGVAIGVFWRNIKAFFTGKKATRGEADPTAFDLTELEVEAKDIEPIDKELPEDRLQVN